MRLLISLVILLFTSVGFAQNKAGFISGTVVDENDKPLSLVSVSILGKANGITTNDSGYFNLKVAANKAIALIFSHTSYVQTQINFYLIENEHERITVRLERTGKMLETVVVTEERERKETGITKINPKNALILPSTTGGIEGLIKILVGSNNELTSQYSVRGGNYDENLIYINDFEIFRPYLVRSGQQEGLSFINPELARNISFYNGGFQAKYGDKMSSVLDVQYKKPVSFGGSAYISLLEQGLHLEGAAKNSRMTYLVGIRNRSNGNLLSSQETKGAYIPSSSDIQGNISYRLTGKIQLELLANYSSSSFTLVPESVEKTTSVFSPLFSANLGLNIFFEGRERSTYKTSMVGLSTLYQPKKNIRIKGMLSRFQNKETENFDIGGTYLFGDRDLDNTSSTFGQITNPLGAGYYQNYGRNQLDIAVWNAAIKGSIDAGRHFIQFGNSIEQTNIKDHLYEWEYQDSAGYSLPVNTTTLSKFLSSSADLSIQKYSGYVQDNMTFPGSKADLTLQGGLRYNYNSLNQEFFVSPRVQLSLKPNWKRDVILKFALGAYNQPPFYRELRRYDGTVNAAVRSQKSYQAVAGFDYNFAAAARPFRITLEAYYKSLRDVIPYDVDNVRIRYYGTNNAKAYAYGLETRLYTELVTEAESWLSFGFMRTKENIAGDQYYDYKNAAGEIITSDTEDRVPTDSISNDVGWLRRPSDRLLTLGLFLQDYLSSNKNFKVHLSILYGSNMPYNIPNNVKYRNALVVDPYIRVDIGFSVLLLGDKDKRRSHSPFKGLDNVWASLEIFNLIDRRNTISYQLIKDYSNSVYTIPNRLTPRLINLKIIGRF